MDLYTKADFSINIVFAFEVQNISIEYYFLTDNLSD